MKIIKKRHFDDFKEEKITFKKLISDLEHFRANRESQDSELADNIDRKKINFKLLSGKKYILINLLIL